jgi:non-heme chloroperoxidase
MKEFFWEERGIYYHTNEFRAGLPYVVFMHGLSGGSSAWTKHEKLISETCNIIAFDLRGHGKSRKYKEYNAYTIAKMADDLAALIEYLHVEKFILVTHSFGCLIALEYFKHHQENVVAAIFLSPNYSVSKMLITKFIRPLFFFTRIFSLIPFSPKPGRHVDYRRHENARDWDISMTVEDVRNTTLRIYLYCSKQTLAVDYTDLLKQINIPILLVHGKNDSIFPTASALYMKEHIRNSELIMLPDADHIIVVNHFDKIGPIIKEYVERQQHLALH